MLSVLEDLLPPRFRKYVVYVLIPFLVLVYGVWQGVGGDWNAFWPALVPAVIGWLVAAPNTHVPSEPYVPPFDTADQPDPGERRLQSPTDEEAVAATANAVEDMSAEVSTADEVEQ